MVQFWVISKEGPPRLCKLPIGSSINELLEYSKMLNNNDSIEIESMVLPGLYYLSLNTFDTELYENMNAKHYLKKIPFIAWNKRIAGTIIIYCLKKNDKDLGDVKGKDFDEFCLSLKRRICLLYLDVSWKRMFTEHAVF